TCSEQSVHSNERVVAGVAEDHVCGRRRLACEGSLQTFQPLERAVEPFEDSIELYSHLIRQRPPRVVVGTRGRTARIWDVVGMILRLKHVEHVRAERLRALHDTR